MCCDSINDEPKSGECKECGEDVDIDGDAINVCGYSPVVCDICNYSPCDGSC